MTPPPPAAALVHRGTADEARQRCDELLEVYTESFAGPPWNESAASADAQRALLQTQLDSPGLEVAIAEHHGRLVGAAYGWPAPPQLPDSDLYRRISAAAGEQLVAQRLTNGVFELVQLMVRPSRQGEGLGRRLVDTLRAGRPSWLITHPEADAVRLYERNGWRAAAALTTSGGVPLVLFVHPTGSVRDPRFERPGDDRGPDSDPIRLP